MKNIVSHLQRRQVFQVDWSREQQLASSLATQHVLLSDILDPCRQLLNGHVVLGFSQCGQFLLSYCSELDVTATHSSYTLHWWHFLGRKPLQYVFKEPLFRGECVPADLHLLVCQTSSPSDTVVVGCRRSCIEDFQRPCYVTVIPSFSPTSTASSGHYSLHFKFDLMPPFPTFVPSLSLRVPSCVVLNTGDSIVALHYSTSVVGTFTANCLPSSPREYVYSSQLTQLLVSGSALQQTATLSGSPASHLLPIDVYIGDQLMADVSLHSDKGAVCLHQVTLDVEIWVNRTLQTELTNRGMSYHSLTDYDLQLAEVCTGSGCVILILVVLLEATPISATCLGSYSVEILASWSIYTGTIQCHQMSRLKPVQPFPHMAGARQWNPAAPLALKYRRYYQSPQLTLTSIRAFSNHSVFSGKSLRCLHHPFLPLRLTLMPSPHPSPAQQ